MLNFFKIRSSLATSKDDMRKKVIINNKDLTLVFSKFREDLYLV
jgi:hypothetical protein